jgi:hypothetical protein
MVTKQVRGLLLALLIVGAFFILQPIISHAYPFGGQASVVRMCQTGVTYLKLGPPRGGEFIWSPTTRTYDFGPPRHVGQWFLGLAGLPTFCVISIFPTIIWHGDYIMMMGSSQ